MLPDPQLFQNDESQEQPPPDRPSPEPGPETPQTIPETHPAQHASGPVSRTAFRKNIQCPDKWACCFVFLRSVAPGLNKQALTPMRGRDGQQLPGVWAPMLGSERSRCSELQSPSEKPLHFIRHRCRPIQPQRSRASRHTNTDGTRLALRTTN